jgi:phosphatidate cytidylyltransferase
MTSFQKRLISGFILAPAVLLVLAAGGVFFAIFVLVAFGLASYEWGKLSMGNAAGLLAGIFYLPVCFLSFYALRAWFGEAGFFLSVSLILTVWASDTGAYFAGKTIGGPKMAPYLSPRKTWAGFCGSVLAAGGALAACFAIAMHFPGGFDPVLPDLPLAFAAGGLAGIVGQVGDLSVSALKRKAGQKDTGNLIPGHGGLLDRIDSLLLVSLYFALIAWIWI